jgi:NAD(P)-dependent dehydrogenase (short-subunit alcohol dehydrogenase family)
MAHVFITGASSGFGHEIAQRLARHGHHVVATMRDSTGRNAGARAALEAAAQSTDVRLHVLDLDVTDDRSVNEAVKAAVERFGPIDVVVNNAGIVSLGLTEAYTPEQFTRVFDVNVNGAVRVNRAVLPAMRAQGRGLLIHVSSAAGRVTVPGLGPYCASKYALEALADAYRYELKPWGIQSVLIEPGIYRTPIFDHAVKPLDAERVAGYGPHGDYVESVGNTFAAAMADPDNPGSSDVADAVGELIAMAPEARPFRTIVSPPIVPLLTPYNEMAETHRAVIAGIFGVAHLLDTPAT